MKVQVNARKKSGVTLVEIMIVLIIGVLLLIPTINMIMSTQRSTFKGYGRLETLTTARIILEKVQRDLKNLCYSNSAEAFIVTKTGKVTTWTFNTFPTEGFAKTLPGTVNPANLVTYRYDEEKKTLVRTVKIHSALMADYTGPNPAHEILGKNVVLFQIKDRTLFGSIFYDIDIKCQSDHPMQAREATHLHSAARSEFEWRLEQNQYQVPNRQSTIDVVK